MKKKSYELTNREIWLCLIIGRFKWYRKYKGGTWSYVTGDYWINRKPYSFETVYKTEDYDED